MAPTAPVFTWTGPLYRVGSVTYQHNLHSIDKRVDNVSWWMDEYPDGLEVVLQEAGKAFVKVGHGLYAEDLPKEYDIRDLAGS